MPYLVRELKQKTLFKGRMTAKTLQAQLDEAHAGGWELDRVVTTSTARFMGFGRKDVHLIIFKRDTPARSGD